MRLLLNGGGDKEQLTETINELDEMIDHNKPLLYIPLAMDEDNISYDSCFEWINKLFLNINIPYIKMVRTFEELEETDLNLYCAIFIGGGNTYKLLKGLKETKCFNKINEYINNDGIVVGGSAGAVIFGYDIDVISSMDRNSVGLTDTKGFDVLNGVSIFPHYINKKEKLSEEKNKERIEKFTDAIILYSKTNNDVIAIPEEDTIFINDDNYEIIGSKEYYMFSKGIKEKIELQNDIKVLYNKNRG